MFRFGWFEGLGALMLLIAAACHLGIERAWLAAISSFLYFAAALLLVPGPPTGAGCHVLVVVAMGLFTYSLVRSRGRQSEGGGGKTLGLALAAVLSTLFVGVAFVVTDTSELTTFGVLFLGAVVGIVTYAVARSSGPPAAASGGVLAVLLMLLAGSPSSGLPLPLVLSYALVYSPLCLLLTFTLAALRKQWLSAVVALALLCIVVSSWWRLVGIIWGPEGPFGPY
jgi:hypothetical protein